MDYRREIDGLRAVAVVPVILFHAGFKIFQGGFVGVDIFFVISGYLITGILISELDQGKFSIVRFYERRVRRILPALFFVMLCCIPFAWAWLVPSEFKDFSLSLVAVTLFASNVLFWLQEGYFAPAAELKPLLHTWSLAVEEQYYVLFPIMLAMVWRCGRRTIFWLLVYATVIGLVVSQWGSQHLPSATFYLAPFRAWELLAGSLCAFHAFGREQGSHDLLSALGLALIVFSIFYFDSSTPFPGLYALCPVVGTALVILCGGAGSWTGRLLAAPGFVAIGLVSYSAYLWHQPLFAFARLRSGNEPGTAQMLALCAATFLLAILSWKFVEQPFRKGTGSLIPSRGGMFAISAIAGAAFVIAGMSGQMSDGFASRLSPEQQRIIAFEKFPFNPFYETGSCFLEPEQTYANFSDKCYSNKVGLLIGDSHAAALSYGIRRELHFGQLTASACPPVMGYVDKLRVNCKKINETIFNDITRDKPPVVIVHARWHHYLNDDFNNKLSDTLHFLHNIKGLRVVVLGEMPQWTPSLPQHLLVTRTGLDRPASIPTDLAELEQADRTVRALALAQGASFVSIQNRICRQGSCMAVVPAARGFAPLVWDYGHLTPAGSVLLAGLLKQDILAGATLVAEAPVAH